MVTFVDTISLTKMQGDMASLYDNSYSYTAAGIIIEHYSQICDDLSGDEDAIVEWDPIAASFDYHEYSSIEQYNWNRVDSAQVESWGDVPDVIGLLPDGGAVTYEY
jgi:hypothetical protein